MSKPDVMLVNPKAGVDGPWNRLREDRLGVSLHFDGSASDRGALEWLLASPACNVSYNWLVLDDGTIRDIAPADARAWHMGPCAPSPQFVNAGALYRDANSALYGIAFAAKAGDAIGGTTLANTAELIAALFRRHGWTKDSVAWRITDHSREAVFGREHPRAGQRGRKVDIGTLLHGVTVDSMADLVRARL